MYKQKCQKYDELRKEVNGVINDNTKAVIPDMSKVNNISSTIFQNIKRCLSLFFDRSCCREKSSAEREIRKEGGGSIEQG